MWCATQHCDVADLALLHLQRHAALRESIIFVPHGNKADGPVMAMEMIHHDVGEDSEFIIRDFLGEVGLQRAI